jgi:hypothetical protein
LKENHRLKVLENKLLKVFGSKEEVGENYATRGFVIVLCTEYF